MSRVLTPLKLSAARGLFAALALSLTAACDDTGGTIGAVCYPGEGTLPVTGTLAVEYDGFAGTAPSDQWPLSVTLEGAEHVYFQGCRQAGDDLWWLELEVELATTAARPAPLGLLDPEAARVSALIARCPGGDCNYTVRSWFGGGPSELALAGTLERFDPQRGELAFDATLLDIAAGTAETSPLRLEAAFEWTPEYEPVLDEPLDGRWLVTNREDTDPALSLAFELTQDGAALAGAVCTEDDDEECTGPEVTGAVADPAIRLFWSDDASGEPAAWQLHAAFDERGVRFSGTVADSSGQVVRVRGERAP